MEWYALSLSRVAAHITPGPSEELDSCEWPNLNAFLANLKASHVFEQDPNFAIWVMVEAFEKDQKAAEDHFGGMRHQYVFGAARWILWNGHNLFKQIIYSEPPEGRTRWSPGPLYDGKPAPSLHRWHFWRDGFKAAAEDASLSDECRGVARKAVVMMEAFEVMLG